MPFGVFLFEHTHFVVLSFAGFEVVLGSALAYGSRSVVRFLMAERGVELIMKDISTVRYDPQRLWEWAAIASEVAEEYSN